MNLIDCHAHCVPPTILEALREFAAGSYLGRTLYADEGFASLEKHLALMDRFGVEKEVINYGNLLVPAARARKLPIDQVVKMVNDYIAEAARIAPGRFVPAAGVTAGRASPKRPRYSRSFARIRRLAAAAVSS